MSARGRHAARQGSRAFTLLELLTVVAIIAVLLGMLVPALAAARRSARSVSCRANLHSLMTALTMYASENHDRVIPSYHMTGVTGGTTVPLDGWGPILDRDRYVFGTRELRGHAFVCPDTLDLAGIESGQTGVSADAPRGYMEWPAVRTISMNYGTTIPQRGFDKIIRVAYWINADNPIGVPRLFEQGMHYSGSVGYGPDPAGRIMRYSTTADIVHPSRLIALADGLYAGKQEATRLGQRDLRIGYRHLGGAPTANIGLADGHVEGIAGDAFPRKWADGLPLEMIRDENLGPGPTVYANPEKHLPRLVEP